MKLLRIIAILLVLGALGVGGAYFAGYLKPANEEEEMARFLDTVTRRDIRSDLMLSGEIVPAVQVEVKSEVGGKVKQIHVNAGQSVKKGELLLTVDDTDLLTERESALKDIEGAQLVVDKNRGNYERARALFDENLISKEVFANLKADLDIAENTLEKSESRLKELDDRLRKTRIEAPTDGTVLDILVDEGQVVVPAASVNAGTALLTVADLDTLLINSHVNQMDAGKLAVGSRIEIRRRPGQEPATARIEHIAPLATVKNNIKGFAIEALIETSQPDLKPGMSVAMKLPVARSDDVLAIPIGAVFRDEDEEVVYVRKGSETERRRVRIGLTNYSYAEVVDGLSEGEEVFLVNPNALGAKS